MLLRIDRLTKSFHEELVLSDLSFSLDNHHVLSIVGRSGCGKTTLLKIIAGLLEPDSGKVLLEDRNINGVSPRERNIVYLYQEALLFPHLNVFENIAFGLRLRKQSETIVREKTANMIRSLDLQEHATKMPHQLSGGQRQRVSFGRALIVNPLLLLLDEPFGNLDVSTRASMQQFFLQMTEQFKITAIFVTHDVKEAILMSTRIGFMDKATVDIYDDVHDFIQDPKTGVRSEIDFWENLIRERYEKRL